MENTRIRRRFFQITAAACMFGSAAGPSAANDVKSHYAMVQTALERHVLPRLQNLDLAADFLPDAVTAVCASGGGQQRAALALAFKKTVEAWAGIEFLRFGPIGENGRRERMSFWPDPRSVMVRQLRLLIAGKDDNAVTAIARQSAAVQGLPALEVLITDTDTPLGPSEAAVFRCALARAIAGNVAALAHEINDGWVKSGGWRDKMMRPGSDNANYKEPSDAAGEFVKALLTELQLLGDVQVKPKLAVSEKRIARPFEKSGNAHVYFEAGVRSASDLYDALALENFLQNDKSWIPDWAGGAWRSLRESDGDGGAAVNVPESAAPPLQEIAAKINGLRQLIGRELATAAGLTIGFNELDGD